MKLLPLMSSFAAVARAGSFTRAAAQLQVSKSVVSRHVAALERELATPLLYRSTHGLRLSEAGEQFLVHCAELERVAEQASGFATSAPARPQGLLRITLPQTLVVSPVGGLLARFQQRHPDVRLDVRVTSLQVDPIGEGFDLALRIGAPEDTGLVYRKLRDVRVLAVATPAYLRRHGTPKSLEDLKQHNCLGYSEFQSRTRWPVAPPGGRRRWLSVSGNLATNSGVLLMHALLEHQGIVIGPDLMFEPHLAHGRLKALLEDAGFESFGLHAVYPPSRFSSVNRSAFVDFIEAGLAGAVDRS